MSNADVSILPDLGADVAKFPTTRRLDAWRPQTIWALYTISLRNICQPKRLISLCLFFSIPIFLVLIGRQFTLDYSANAIKEGENALIYSLIAMALAPLTALLFASGMIHDEVEQQTLTYLLIRPISRPLLYIVKLLAAITVACLLIAFFVPCTFIAIHAGAAEGKFPDVLWDKALPTVGFFLITVPIYCAVFGLVGMITRWTLVIGAVYIIVVENVLAAFEFAIRKFSILYHFRVMVERKLELKNQSWNIDLETAPAFSESLQLLGGFALVCVVVGAWITQITEFRVKTPEG